MAKTFLLEVVTPEKIVFSEQVTELVVPAHEGYLGVLAGHAPLLCTLQPGEIKVEMEKGKRFYSTAGGFMEVSPEKTILLSEALEIASEIDAARAEKALERARGLLADPSPETNRDRARRAIARAQNRLKIARKRG